MLGFYFITFDNEKAVSFLCIDHQSSVGECGVYVEVEVDVVVPEVGVGPTSVERFSELKRLFNIHVGLPS